MVRILLALGVCFFMLPGSMAAADGPTVEATVTTISAGALAANIGIQGIALNADRTLLYVAEGGRFALWTAQNGCARPGEQVGGPAGAVGVFSTASRTKVAQLPISTGFPIHAELDATTGRVYVAVSSHGVYAYEGTTQVGVSPALGGAPHDVGIDSSNGRGLVTNTFDTTQTYLSLIDLSSLQVIAHVNTTGFGPHKAVVDPARHLAYVTHAEFSKIDVVDMQTGQLLRQIATGLTSGGAQNAIDLTRRRLYSIGQIGSGAGATPVLIAINLATEQVVGQISLPVGWHGTRVDPATGLVWVGLGEQGQVAVIDPDTFTERARIPVGHCPYYLDIDPVRRLAYVTNHSDNTISVLDMTKVPDSSALPAPANLSSSVQGTTVTLSWSAVSGAASYDIEAGSSSGLSDLAVLNVTSLGFSGAAGPGTYYVRVRAKTAAGGSGAASEEVTVRVGATGCSSAPGAPSGLSAATAGGGAVVLTWAAPPGAITSFVLEAGSGPGQSDLANTDLGSAATTLTASGVPAGVYYVRVRAKNTCGTGPPSSETIVTLR